MPEQPKKVEKKLQKDLVNHVFVRARLNVTYVLLFVFSAIITTLGLMVNNTAVVIGGMLISPLLWPVIGISLSIFKTRKSLAARSVITLAVSILLGIVVCALVAYITPIKEITEEIAVRMQPTLIDLFIALAASVIGVLALYYPRISSTAAGVAISISLLPPLCVSGIAVAFWDGAMFWRAFLLLSTNIAAMIFAGIVTLYFLHFRPRRKAEEATVRVGFLMSLVILLLFAVPLSIYLRDTLSQTQIRTDIATVLEEQVAAISDQAQLDDVQVDYVPSFDREVTVQATIFLPEGIYLTEAEKNGMIEALTDQAGRTVDLQLNVVNTLLLRRQEDEQFNELRQDIESYLQAEVRRINAEAEIDSIEIVFPENGEMNAETQLFVKMLMKQIDGIPVTFQQKEDLQAALSQHTGQTVELEIEFIPVRRLTEPDASLKLKTQVQNVLFQDFGAISDGISLLDVEVEEGESDSDAITVISQILVPEAIEVTVAHQQAIESDLRKETERTINLVIQIVPFQTLQDVAAEPVEEFNPVFDDGSEEDES
ncbi:MAG: TIGR00341 family protein [Candidatus Kerfeldbacteria bacterium]